MKNLLLILSCVLLLSAPSYAQTEVRRGAGAGAGSGSGTGAGSGDDPQTGEKASTSNQTKTTTTTKTEEQAQASRYPWVRTLTNVQIELTLTDQVGTAPAEKKTVSMIVSSGNWGKIRSAGTVHPPAEPPYGMELNVDARPFVSTEGPVQLELTVSYSPPASSPDKDNARTRPTGINQSLTVVLQSAKSLIVSQAADPLGDRKVIVEVKATVLK